VGQYAPGKESIAIRTNYRTLRLMMPSEPVAGCVFMGRVRYIDYARERIPEGNGMWQMMHKQKHYDFEREIRVLTQPFFGGRRSPLEEGWMVDVDPGALIQGVHVAPGASEEFRARMEQLCRTYGVAAKVLPSALDAQPIR
jgi:hypothetical protein